jgi:Fe2+ transport system protein FeoA
MFGNGSGRRLHGTRCGRRIPLSEGESGSCGEVVDNTGTRAMEMGFFPGAAVEVLSNEPGASSLVVLAGDSRFVVSREIAGTVIVRMTTGGRRRRRGGIC